MTAKPAPDDSVEVGETGGATGSDAEPVLRSDRVLPTGRAAVAKRLLDLVGATAGLMMAAPFMAAIALAVKLDSPGPVFFSQERSGALGKPFRMYKFRTMVADAEAQLARYVDLDALAEPQFKLRHDPRVTRVGRLLRRTSLDELPQLVNVLWGDMSLVGPRPEECRLVERYDDWQRQRILMKPGLTGPAQVSGRGDLGLDARVRLEVAYMRQYSLLKDLQILARTVPAVLRRTGAY